MGVIFILPGVILLFFSLVIGMEIFMDWELDRIQKNVRSFMGASIRSFCRTELFIPQTRSITGMMD